MEKTICIDGRELRFKATARTPLVYRQAFGRDLYVDIKSLIAGFGSDADMPVDCLNAFECISYCLNAQAEGKEIRTENIQTEMEEWLDQFDTFSIYHIFPQIMDLWRESNSQTVKAKNPDAQPTDL